MGKPNLAYDSSRLRCASSLVLGRSLEYELSHSGSRTARCPTSAALPKSTRQMEGSAGRLQTCPLVVAGGGGVGKQALVDRHTLCAATYCCIGATCFHKVAHLCVALSRARMSLFQLRAQHRLALPHTFCAGGNQTCFPCPPQCVLLDILHPMFPTDLHDHWL
jgi:hypothetical protein